MTIWLITLFENTPIDDNQNTRYNSIVREATQRGHKVVIWASTFKHNIKKQRFLTDTTLEHSDLVTINFVKGVAYSKNISLKRLYSHYVLSKSLIKKFATQDKPDVILNAFPPISVAFEASQWSKVNSIPFVLDIIDPWPDVFLTHFQKLKNPLKLLIRPLQNRFKQTIAKSNLVTSISKRYLDWARTYATESFNAACFYPAIQLPLNSASTKLEDKKLRIIYAGSLGYSYDIPTILKAAEIVEKQDPLNIEFIIAGDGPQKNLVQEYASRHSNLMYVGRVSKERLAKIYSECDLGLTQHVKGATQSVTYKLFDLLGSGLPILNSLESEMKDIILDNEVGMHNDPNDVGALVKNILTMNNDRDRLKVMKVRSVDLTRQIGDAKIVYASFVDHLENVVIA